MNRDVPPTSGPLGIVFQVNQTSAYSGGGGGGSVGPNIVCSSINVAQSASISSLTVSSINGAAPGTAVIPPNLVASTLTLAADNTGNTLLMEVSNVGGSYVGKFSGLTTLGLAEMSLNTPGISTNQVATSFGTGLSLVVDATTGIALESSKGGVIQIATPGTINLASGAIGTLPNCDLTISSINTFAPAYTTYTQKDVGTLFAQLFEANPSLSTIVF